jgi:nucleotide sugar dehydrogenase
MKQNKVTIIGLGVVGKNLYDLLKTKGGYKVYGYDINGKRVDEINDKRVSTDPDIIKESEFIVVCVPTSVKKKGLSLAPDYTNILNVAETIGQYVEPNQKIILESTVGIGDTENIFWEKIWTSNNGKNRGIQPLCYLGYCPERVDPGSSRTIANTNRTLGLLNPSHNIGEDPIWIFYRDILNDDTDIFVVNINTAEMIKLYENVFRDINIAYVNGISHLCNAYGIDVLEVIEGATKKGFGYMPFYPSIGVGGDCIPINPYYLLESMFINDVDLYDLKEMIKDAREINDKITDAYIKFICNLPIKTFQLMGAPVKVLVLGLSYKANTGDTRNSPALRIIKGVSEEKPEFDIKGYDPFVPEFSNFDSLEEAIKGRTVIVLAVNHKEFVDRLTGEFLENNHIELIIDGQNCLDASDIRSHGVLYTGVGR